MSDLTSLERVNLEKLFDMDGGYVLDFSNRTFGEFFLENTGLDIYDSKYLYSSGSKANRLRAFWKTESNEIVGEFTFALLEYWKLQRGLNNQLITLAEKRLYEECIKISDRLMNNNTGKSQRHQDLELTKKKEEEASKDYQLNLLFTMFEDLAKSTDVQKRGFLLQDLLNRLFTIYGIPVTRSFQRNDGGEQIDGAFSFQGWHYLVECKWTKKLADIRELDSLLGKINRSGKQGMGLFLSIEGWSIHVPSLLKQNPEKCIILMDGYDLRSILSRAVELDVLLQEKIAKLNAESEPFLSVVEILKNNNK